VSGDVLAIVGRPEEDPELLEQVAGAHPTRVTLLADESVAGEARTARLIGAIEQRTGAAIVGLARSREQLRGWRFDCIVGPGSGRGRSRRAAARPRIA
jgi:hypothetical protein